MKNLKNLVKYEVDLRDDLFSYEKGKPHYVMVQNGIFKITRNDAILNKVRLADLTTDFKIPLLKSVEEGFEYILPKIPFKHYLNILDFFKAVHEKDRTEASCMIYYNHTEEDLVIPEEFKETAEKGLVVDGKWLVYAPIQVNSSGLTDFTGDALDSWLRDNSTKVIECHSHHTMDAFWSGTDNANQKENMFYGVFGHINTEDKFLLKAIANDGKLFNHLDVTTLFEFPHVLLTKEVQDLPEDLESAIDERNSRKLVKYTGKFNRLDNFHKGWLEQHTPAHESIRFKGGSYPEIDLDFDDTPTKLRDKGGFGVKYESDGFGGKRPVRDNFGKKPNHKSEPQVNVNVTKKEKESNIIKYKN